MCYESEIAGNRLLAMSYRVRFCEKYYLKGLAVDGEVRVG